jgi:hypothetical protein
VEEYNINVKLKKIKRAIPKIFSQPKRALILFFMFFFSKDQEVSNMASWLCGRIPRVPLTEVFPGIENINVTILRVFDRVPGASLDTKEILILAAIMKYANAKNILEIGT